MSWSFESVAVVGAGAVGLYYGGRLADAGEEVAFLLRSDFPEVSVNGLQVESVQADFRLKDLRCFRDASEMMPVDLVIVSWKATANGRLAEVLPHLLHERTEVLTLQNGLGNCEAIAKIVGPGRVMGGLCFVCINRIKPGLIRHSAGGRVTIGEYAHGVPGRAEELVRRFKAAGLPAKHAPDLPKAQWEKLVWNVPFNGWSVAEGGVTTDELLDGGSVESEVRAVMAEVISAARAMGLDLSDDLIEFNIELTRQMGPYKTSSMIDFVEGREVELEPIWGEPIRRAMAAGVPMPRSVAMVDRIKTRMADRQNLLGG